MRMDKQQANIEQTKAAGVKEPIFYYVYGANDTRITICLLVNTDDLDTKAPISTLPLSKGISICSGKDNFSKKEGRAKAYGRAIKAFINRSDSIPYKGIFLASYAHTPNEREVGIIYRTIQYQKPKKLKEDAIVLANTEILSRK